MRDGPPRADPHVWAREMRACVTSGSAMERRCANSAPGGRSGTDQAPAGRSPGSVRVGLPSRQSVARGFVTLVRMHEMTVVTAEEPSSTSILSRAAKSVSSWPSAACNKALALRIPYCASPVSARGFWVAVGGGL